jgi:threonine synthase
MFKMRKLDSTREAQMSVLQCIECGSIAEPYPPRYRCAKCGGPLEYKIDIEKAKNVSFAGGLTFWRYRKMLPETQHLATMQEGGTPLYRAERLAREMDLAALYLKDETRNPTNSFRDRAAALVTANILDLNYTAAVCATNGNMGASLSAYCAKYEVNCHLLIPRLVDMGKLAQMLVYDAVIEEHGETVDESIKRAEELAKETGWYQATPELNPLVVEAQKTIAYEVSEQLGIPDWLITSMGSGGTVYSVWKGFRELHEIGIIEKMPRIIGVQAEGCSPIVDAYNGSRRSPPKPSTHAIGILVAKPLQSDLALAAIKQSNGMAVSIPDEEIFQAERQIAKLEGLFAEPASSGTIAVAKELRGQGVVDKNESIVCLITGSGLKATDVLQALSKKRKTAIVGAEFSTKEKILRVLDKKDSYGYELWKELGKTMTRSAVYQHLNELCSRGLISTYDRKGRKYFAVTRRGRRVLKAIDEAKTIS